MEMVRKLHRKKKYNSIFYCTYTEINYGSLDMTVQSQFGPIFQEMTQKNQASIIILANELLPKFLNSKFGLALTLRLRQKEMQGQQSPLKTVAAGLDKNAESFWHDMFKVVSESMSIGMVYSDMTVPGIPLCYINEGFRNVTGYGKEKIGCNARFLQGPATEPYLIEEICETLRHGEPLVVKLHNHKATGQKFQCLVAMNPVYGPNKEYKYMIGMQIDFNMNPDITRQLLEMERALRFLPRSVGGDDHEDVLSK
jgi:hypothetical protein